ncbi:unnamed protein product [Hydatigera taeniaeformis]|uniref:TGS domain-containing protein n=1 Tax=Hydatigena taeniaeformis TaxID=6205 RepID=A0A0R3XAT7_HYDTA|nr:unnamed protein product [Hydatigera taeniaeformis]
MLRGLCYFTEMGWTIRARRPIFLSLSQRRKCGDKQRRDQILRESEALGVLTRNADVQVYLSPDLSKSLREELSSAEVGLVKVKSSVLKDLFRKGSVTMKVVCSINASLHILSNLITLELMSKQLSIEDRGTLPVLEVSPILNANGCAVGSALASPRAKVLKLRTTIDDHMMGVKVRQISELLAKGYEVIVSVRLPPKQMKHLTGTLVLSDEQKLSVQKVSRIPLLAISLAFAAFQKLYESNAQRFMNAFRDCSSKPPKLIQNKDFQEFTIILCDQQ